MNKNCCKKINADIPMIADLLRIISEENRLKIICFLGFGERCVCEIWKFLELPQNLISHHLKILKDYNLLNSKKKGLNVYYSVNRKELNRFHKLLNEILKNKGALDGQER